MPSAHSPSVDAIVALKWVRTIPSEVRTQFLNRPGCYCWPSWVFWSIRGGVVGICHGGNFAAASFDDTTATRLNFKGLAPSDRADLRRKCRARPQASRHDIGPPEPQSPPDTHHHGKLTPVLVVRKHAGLDAERQAGASPGLGVDSKSVCPHRVSRAACAFWDLGSGSRSRGSGSRSTLRCGEARKPSI